VAVVVAIEEPNLVVVAAEQVDCEDLLLKVFQ
jgi:hypothetical protein